MQSHINFANKSFLFSIALSVLLFACGGGSGVDDSSGDMGETLAFGGGGGGGGFGPNSGNEGIQPTTDGDDKGGGGFDPASEYLPPICLSNLSDNLSFSISEIITTFATNPVQFQLGIGGFGSPSGPLQFFTDFTLPKAELLAEAMGGIPEGSLSLRQYISSFTPYVVLRAGDHLPRVDIYVMPLSEAVERASIYRKGYIRPNDPAEDNIKFNLENGIHYSKRFDIQKFSMRLPSQLSKGGQVVFNLPFDKFIDPKIYQGVPMVVQICQMPVSDMHGVYGTASTIPNYFVLNPN